MQDRSLQMAWGAGMSPSLPAQLFGLVPVQRCAHTCHSLLQSYATLANSDSEQEGVGIVASAKRWLAGASRKGSARMPG